MSVPEPYPPLSEVPASEAPAFEPPWFQSHRGALFALAYRMLGSVSDAEDVVQDAYLRVRDVDPGSIDNPGPYLKRVATHLCLDQLKSARKTREVYPGTWLPEPVVEQQSFAPDAARHSDISFALMLTFERLTPLERAAFLLHDVFDAGYAELAATLERSEAACRQLVSRAREQLQKVGARFQPSAADVNRVLLAFARATQSGDTEALRAVLTDDAVLLSDGGGKARSALLPIYGSDKIARFFVGVGRKWPLRGEVRVRQVTVNGLPGFVVRHGGEPFPSVFAFQFSPTGVECVYSMRNPDKTRHLAAEY